MAGIILLFSATEDISSGLFVWELKDKNIDFDLTWKILDRA